MTFNTNRKELDDYHTGVVRKHTAKCLEELPNGIENKDS